MRKIRKGFTLMELLIVIALLGALAAMASISGSEAMTTAKAGNIINNLRNLSTAVNEYCYDNMNNLYELTALPARTEIWYYMNEGVSNDTKVPEAQLSNYYIASDTDISATHPMADATLFVGYKFPATGEAGADEAIAIKEKLANRAKEVGLYGTAANATAVGTTPAIFLKTHGIVWMKTREKSRRTATVATGG